MFSLLQWILLNMYIDGDASCMDYDALWGGAFSKLQSSIELQLPYTATVCTPNDNF